MAPMAAFNLEFFQDLRTATEAEPDQVGQRGRSNAPEPAKDACHYVPAKDKGTFGCHNKRGHRGPCKFWSTTDGRFYVVERPPTTEEMGVSRVLVGFQQCQPVRQPLQPVQSAAAASSSSAAAEEAQPEAQPEASGEAGGAVAPQSLEGASDEAFVAEFAARIAHKRAREDAVEALKEEVKKLKTARAVAFTERDAAVAERAAVVSERDAARDAAEAAKDEAYAAAAARDAAVAAKDMAELREKTALDAAETAWAQVARLRQP